VHELIRVEVVPSVIVTSDRLFREVLEGRTPADESGRLAKEILESRYGKALGPVIIPNNVKVIAGIVEYMSSFSNLMLITGGTGISARDQTVEAVRSVVEKELEGFGEYFRRLSEAEVGVNALLSRAMAGVYRRSLIFVVPGSPRAVRLALERIVIPIAEHALSELYR